MDPDRDPDRPVCECAPSLLGRGYRRGRRRERDEERVALRVHLHTAILCERFPQHVPVLRKRVGIPLAKLAQKPRRRLDIREEERHRARRELAHNAIVRADCPPSRS